MDRKIKWGVIGAGGIADRRTMPGMMLAKNAELIAVMDVNENIIEGLKEKYNAKHDKRRPALSGISSGNNAREHQDYTKKHQYEIKIFITTPSLADFLH